MNTVKRRLFDKLKNFYSDRDFVLGVISNVDTDENYQKILDYIDKGEDVSVESILTLSVLLDHETQKLKEKNEDNRKNLET